MKQAWSLTTHNPAAGIDMEDYLEDYYLFTKRLVQIWINVGVDQICFKKCTQLPVGFEKFLEFALVISQHPSLTVGLMMLHFWWNALRHEYVSQVGSLI